MAPPFIGQRHSTHAVCGLAIPRGGTSAASRITSYPGPPNLITGVSPRCSREALRPADNKLRLSAAGFAPLLLCLLYPDDLVGCVVAGVIRAAALRARTATGGLLQGGQSLLYGP
jgi:hypothetical protein